MIEQSHDIQGRPYLTVGDAKPGVMVKCDGDFTCMGKGRKMTIRAAGDGSLWVACSHGKHSLDGQLSDDGKTYVGLYPA